MANEMIDSREAFDLYTPTDEDWAEYEAWLAEVEGEFYYGCDE